jgi:hypothetical protein
MVSSGRHNPLKQGSIVGSIPTYAPSNHSQCDFIWAKTVKQTCGAAANQECDMARVIRWFDSVLGPT